MTRIAILDDYLDIARTVADWSVLEGATIEVFTEHIADEDELVARLRGVPIVSAMRERTPIPRSLLSRLPDLRLLVTTGMQNAAIDLDAARDLGVTVCGTRASGSATAELTIGLMLALARRLPQHMEGMTGGGWQIGLGRELAGATLGIVGLGRLGHAVSRYAKVFGMEVIAWSENLTDETANAAGVRRVSKAELFAQADFVSLHVRLSPRTVGIVGRAELELMKPDAFLINTARGALVDNDAMVSALRSGRLAGAALDVFEREPLPPDDPLRQVPGLLLTPHLGYFTTEVFTAFYRQTVEAIKAWMDGAPIRVIS